MYIGYGNHNGNKKTILVYYDMTFYAFYLFFPSMPFKAALFPHLTL